MDKLYYKEILIETFKSFINVCEKNNLQYFCIGGTLIGAVRHQGMIPWDDDIDVIMPRPDYDRLLKLAFNENESFELITMDNNLNYYLPYAKFCHKKSSVLEYKDIPCVLGLFVDIFPLDGANEDVENRRKDYIEFKREANKLHIQPKIARENIFGCIKHVLKGHLRTAWNELYYSFNKKEKRNNIIQNIKSKASKYSYTNSIVVGNYGGMWGLKEFWRKEWFDHFKICQFESIQVKIPIGFDEILRHVYGDYMKLPSKENRVSHHNLAYINLEKRLTFKEVVEQNKNLIV